MGDGGDGLAKENCDSLLQYLCLIIRLDIPLSLRDNRPMTRKSFFIRCLGLVGLGYFPRKSEGSTAGVPPPEPDLVPLDETWVVGSRVIQSRPLNPDWLMYDRSLPKYLYFPETTPEQWMKYGAHGRLTEPRDGWPSIADDVDWWESGNKYPTVAESGAKMWGDFEQRIFDLWEDRA